MEGAPPLQRVIDGLAGAAATYSDLIVKGALDTHGSDHASCINAGLPAVLTIRGGDESNDRIYFASDTLDHVDSDLALRILRLNVACIVQELGDGDQRSVRLMRGCSDRVTPSQAAFIQYRGILPRPHSCDGHAGQWLCMLTSGERGYNENQTRLEEEKTWKQRTPTSANAAY